MAVFKKWQKIGLVLIVGLAGLLLGGKASANTVGFEVSPVIPKNQVDQSVTYFDLKLKPQQTQTLAVNVKNTSSKSITVHTSVAKATTNVNAAVQYKYLKADKSINLPYDISKLITTKQRNLTLKKGESKVVNFKIKMPKKSYEGLLVGGLTFLKQADKKPDKHAVAIRNQYSYTIATVLHGKKEFKKNQLTLGEIKATQSNSYNQISIELENRTAAFLNKLATNVQIYKYGGTKAVYQQKNKNGQMAPNSVYALPLKVGTTPLKPGKYTAKIIVTSKKQHWEFTKDFTITGKQADKLNKSAVIDHQTNWWLWIGVGLLILLLLALLGYYIYRKQRKIKDLEKQLREQQENDNH
ncbi:DUF916 and DUF3324 domain-containing protein [Lactiplantibacillus garii]|uniref:DUF916 and DUF3324 domain-containing protein n=1 Tax=Lactiplantibacillus garii TaxID=2306423 RepID=A0A3R8KL73_9LACO|nr:DUF916 and DUF3324 domain-containing protein [Lactiplantibacillus garii]RRK10317.1 DUF916 and DUF3324 domain-containing protein [Lactiplantibacillus garii]